MSTVSIENVRKVYGGDSDIVAVDDISFEIADGEFLTIVGPSGSGKSTLLRMIAGLEDITEGTIRIGDRVVNGVQPQDRDVAMVFQNYALYPHMTARKNMSYGLQLTTDLPEDEINQRVMDAAEMMGVTDQLDKHPGNLSGGQQQRIATGRAIVREPSVFLFDEPLSNLDAKLRLHMRTELQQLQDTLGTTTVYVTHDQEEAMTMSDRIAVVDGGELQQIGTPEEIYNEPRNLFVGDFVGNPPMNQFEVRLSGTSLVADGFSYDLSERVLEHIKQYADGVDEFVLGIRPENITLTDSDEPNAVRAFLDVREPVGSDNYLHFDIEGEECWVRVPGDVKPDTNQELSLAFDEERLHLFRQSDGINILAQEEPPLEVTAGQNT
ncbi:sugar ABC transporter ATP-binding protein [Haloferax sp. Atlit-47N]|uniref:Sn-glycerol-3-phosphate ABC transporter ATP-binding protein UgpC n=1 Tax=Haloferax sp. Atlit-48N TaxID=2077198 RepID=A0ACD5I1P3_9EURY|nr:MULTISPECIES: sn-glycerol-3-phosphate ABC transporter ATP-binding protein UgpC [unclassified Haloferax]RDZ30851.1 sugar ABC transporter ATP-binding protein [Haloferax sp. Atlit-48N]RDZ38517.1 sugar ABC transporter ATP-binding protein [Haloferax sp. Atlit-47N]